MKPKIITLTELEGQEAWDQTRNPLDYDGGVLYELNGQTVVEVWRAPSHDTSNRLYSVTSLVVPRVPLQAWPWLNPRWYSEVSAAINAPSVITRMEVIADLVGMVGWKRLGAVTYKVPERKMLARWNKLITAYIETKP